MGILCAVIFFSFFIFLLPTVFFFLDPDPDPEAGHSGLCGKQHSSLDGSGH